MQKGGVGKTTTAVNLGAALAELGQRVLLIDLDAQGHLTLHMKPPGELGKTIYHLLLEPDTTVTDVVQEAPQMGVHYIPADIELAGAENQMINEIGRESILRDKLEPVQRRYDFIIMDCPPSLDLIVINALVAANEVLVPMQAEFLALKGMQELLVTMERVKRRLNPRLELIGILPTLYKQRALALAGGAGRGPREVRRQGLRVRRHRFDPFCRDAARGSIDPHVRPRVRRREVVPCAGGSSHGESQVGMPTFKRAALGGSEDLFRPTRPQVVSDTDDVIKDSVDRHVQREPVVYRTLNFTAEEIELLHRGDPDREVPGPAAREAGAGQVRLPGRPAPESPGRLGRLIARRRS